MDLAAASRKAPGVAAVALLAALGAPSMAKDPASGPRPMTWADLLSRPLPRPALAISYGPLSQQYGELWIPDGRTRPPLVVMIHGGCWTKSVANLSIMNYAAEDLRRRGLAVWNVEYRGVDEAGGGYPGTYLDLAAALDAAVGVAASHHLSFAKAVVIGHSAGGHLALWAAARHKLPPTSPLYRPSPLAISAVVDLAGLADLKENLDTACGPGPVIAMRGEEGPGRPDVYADTSPAALAPLGAAQYVIHGAQDVTVRPEIGAAYAAIARRAGDEVHLSTPPGGHVEEIAPGTESWSRTAALIETLAR